MRALHVLCLLILLGAASTVGARNLSDNWWVPEESGWGLNVIHEDDLLSLTLFVHDAAGQPRWLTAAMQRYGSTQAGDPEFAGSLIETLGTAPDRPWDPNAAVSRTVGEIQFRARPGGTAELAYTLDGIAVSRSVQRLSTQAANLEGLHFGMLLPGYDTCPAGFEGLSVFERGTLQVDLCEECDSDPASGTPVLLVLNDGAREICSISGSFARYGVSGAIDGAYQCSDGGEGTLTMRDIEFTSTGFTARFSADHPVCAEFSGLLNATRANAR